MITTILFKTDKALKEEVQEIASKMGIPLSTLINAQLRELARSRRITITAPLVPNAKTARLLRNRIADLDSGKNTVGPFKTAKEANAWLDS